ncbi:VWA domain-containing protein [Roseimaritima sediminicola]|uniref:VWA domain-containing protein n=1 Tax=Roseimaritima sediminicola TaxID=2662066 RepID=UPI0013869DB1|nr:VWA domain-containing protein [Roseimaritima sediminicola]
MAARIDMMDVQYGNPNQLVWLAAVAAGLILAIWSWLARRRAARRFAQDAMRTRLFPARRGIRYAARTLLLAGSLALLVVALTDIRWGKTWREVPQRGIEIMFVLDVSRSMLAQDVAPSRLDRAKQQIMDIVDELAGDRIGLVTFAGATRQSVPLTSHYHDFKQTLDAAGPHSVRRGGSRLGDALEAAADGFLDKTHQHRVIVVFTDGEDQESQPVEVATRLHQEQGIRVFTVGLGDPETGARIPDQDTARGGPPSRYVTYNGEQVWSKMDGRVLQAVAEATAGAYIPAGTRRVDMAGVYRRYIANVPQTEFETARINAYVARYQWFAAPALLLLLIEVWLSTAAGRRPAEGSDATSALSARSMWQSLPACVLALSTWETFARFASKMLTISCLLAVTVSTAAAAAQSSPPAQQPDGAAAMREANDLVRNGQYEAAVERYRQMDVADQHRAQFHYNLGVALYRSGHIAEAQEHFRQAAASGDGQLAARSRYNLGNSFYAQAVSMVEQDRQQTLAALEHAIEHYRATLRIAPGHTAARANLELAARWCQELRDQPNEPQPRDSSPDSQASEEQDEPQEQPEDPQEQPEDSQGEDQSDPSAESNDSREQDRSSESGPQDASEDEPDQGQDSPPNENTPSPDDEKPSPDDSNQSPDDSNQSPNDSNSSTGDENPSADDETAGGTDGPPNDPEADQNPSSQDPMQSLDQHGQQPENAPEPAADTGDEQGDAADPRGQLAAAGDGDGQETESGGGAVNMGQGTEMMSREEAMKLLQAVRDREMLRRVRKEMAERRRHRPVERDW